MKKVLYLFLGAFIFASLMFYIKEVRSIEFFCKTTGADGELSTKIYCQKK